MRKKLEENDIVMYDHEKWTVWRAEVNKKRTKILISENGEDLIQMYYDCGMQPPSINEMIKTGDIIPVTPEVESQSEVIGCCMYG